MPNVNVTANWITHALDRRLGTVAAGSLAGRQVRLIIARVLRRRLKIVLIYAAIVGLIELQRQSLALLAFAHSILS